MKRILILHTGGTLASKVSYQTGGVISRFTPEDILELFPEIRDLANVDAKLVRNMFSEDMRFSHHNLIAREIAKAHATYDAIIVTHGTDTLHYTSAALSFMLEHLNKPILLVGAQRSSDRGSSDAAINLLCAIHYSTKTNYAGVAICMHENPNDEACLILPGLKVRKMHSSRRDAFRTINGNPIARVTKHGEITSLAEHYPKQEKEKKELTIKLLKENLKIGIIKAHPNFYAEELNAYKNFHGLILEGTGLGHFPVNTIDAETREHTKILNAIKKLVGKIPIVMSTQCIQGRVDLNVYETGRKLQAAGVIGNFSDMTTETAFIKLAYLLSNYPKKKVKELFMQNLHGELSERISYEKDLL